MYQNLYHPWKATDFFFFFFFFFCHETYLLRGIFPLSVRRSNDDCNVNENVTKNRVPYHAAELAKTDLSGSKERVRKFTAICLSSCRVLPSFCFYVFSSRACVARTFLAPRSHVPSPLCPQNRGRRGEGRWLV